MRKINLKFWTWKLPKNFGASPMQSVLDEEPLDKNNPPKQTVNQEVARVQEFIKRRDDASLDLIQSQAMHNFSTSNNLAYLVPLAEIRMAMNYGSIAEGDTGLGERAKIQPQFEEIDRGRLRKRYFLILDDYLEKVLKLKAVD